MMIEVIVGFGRTKFVESIKNSTENIFTKDLCEWAVERMENRNGTTHHYSLDEVKSI